MGIRNKVNSTGWVSEKIGGTDVEVDLSNATQTTAPLNKVGVVRSGSTSVTSPVVLLAGATAHATASLPSISTSIVGKTFLVVATGSNTTFLTASNAINGGLWTRTLTNTFSIVTCVAASTDGGFTWIASSGSAI